MKPSEGCHDARVRLGLVDCKTAENEKYKADMDANFAAKIQDLTDWVISEALIADDYVGIYEGFHCRLVEAGVPICRAHVAMPTLHPLAEIITITWRPDTKATLTMIEHGSRQTDDWLNSPIKAMMEGNLDKLRIGPDDIDSAAEKFPVVATLRDEGVTDYIVFGIPFSSQPNALQSRSGLVATYATDQKGGFTAAQIEGLERVLPRFSLVAKLANRERLFHNILDAYLGADAGRRVREGQITLGSGQMIDAVIWFCDLRHSTPLAEKLGHEAFLEVLNDYFAALAGAVMDNGGDVLRFIGDAALAIFPISDDGFDAHTARKKALEAAHEAINRAREINAERQANGDEPFEFGIGLHVGRIMYGNIGVPERVEFSVIGPAANEAARIESLCRETGQTVLISEQFADGLEENWQDLGSHAIRGSEKELRLFTLPTLSTTS